ncbi:Protein air1 [Bienertia sinuspersici]
MFDEACTLAMKVERKECVSKLNVNKPNGVKSEASAIPSKQPQETSQKESKIVVKLKASQGTLMQGQQKMKQVVCYKCQGLGHISKKCPNKVLVTR